MKPTLPLLLIAAGAVSAAEALPEPAAIEMKRLQETYRVLDFTAEKVWPGWKNYRDVPFLFEFENGLRLLVRHPQPPSPFQPVEGLKVESRQVFADRSAVTAKPLVAPLLAGGGPIPFGTGADGKPVQVVRINLRSAAGSPNDDDAPARIRSEEQISVYLHELFHCFQRTLGLQVFGNLRINADTRFAAYSEVEGLALGRAYAEKDPAKASEYLADFLAARRARRTAMNLMQQYQESSDEFNEGTATYAQVRTYEILRSGGYTPGLTSEEDRYFRGFRDLDPLIAQYESRLRSSATSADYVYMKGYNYGCFQALLCDRLFPGWQKSFKPGGAASVHQTISANLAVGEEDWPGIEKRIEDRYNLPEIRERYARHFDARDSALRLIRERKGRVYVVDCKAVTQALEAKVTGAKAMRVGLMALLPNGFESLAFDQVSITGLTSPAHVDQLYYLRVVDTGWQSREKPYSVSGAAQPDGSWKSAVVVTPLFTLKAPRVRVEETGNLVKIKVLARVAE